MTENQPFWLSGNEEIFMKYLLTARYRIWVYLSLFKFIQVYSSLFKSILPPYIPLPLSILTFLTELDMLCPRKFWDLLWSFLFLLEPFFDLLLIFVLLILLLLNVAGVITNHHHDYCFNESRDKSSSSSSLL